MPKFEEQTGRTKKVVLKPEITRAFWSRRRAWQGAQVKLFIETRYLKEGTPLKIEIWEDGAESKQPEGYVARLNGDYRVKNGRCTADYKIKWDSASLGKDLQLSSDRFEFCFTVTVEKPPLRAKSNLLYVDLHRLVVSA
jgi:hypothetical protein